MSSLGGFALAGLAFGLLTFFLFMAGEAGVPAATRLRLGSALAGEGSITSSDRARAFGGVLDRVFGTDAFSLRFIGAALLFSLLTFLLFFATYLLRLPVFAQSLLDDGFQRQAVAHQVVTMFLPMNMFITYLGLAYCREVVMQVERSGKARRLPLLLAKDVLMKVVLVLLAMGLVYLALTPGGSFKGPWAALLAVPGVFLGALQFQNLNCVYIYSSIVSSLWLWAFLISSLGGGAPVRMLGFILPLERHPVRAVGMVTAGLSVLFYWAIVVLAH